MQGQAGPQWNLTKGNELLQIPSTIVKTKLRISVGFIPSLVNKGNSKFELELTTVYDFIFLLIGFALKFWKLW